MSRMNLNLSWLLLLQLSSPVAEGAIECGGGGGGGGGNWYSGLGGSGGAAACTFTFNIITGDSKNSKQVVKPKPSGLREWKFDNILDVATKKPISLTFKEVNSKQWIAIRQGAYILFRKQREDKEAVYLQEPGKIGVIQLCKVKKCK